jgi:transcriptional regulator with PAS, ATPase and Fis domain
MENRALREQVERGGGSKEIVGSSPAIEKLLERARRVARKDANVMITGETGTGKELFARFIHDHSARKTKPFVPVDCAALPEGLLESELFGYERGAFTGADSRKIGLLESAHRGTVFLDEVTELTLSLQSKLLRMLEERQIRRLGSSQLVDIDIRVLAATNVELEASVASGKFREDLYYRLNVVPLHVPPLRERGGDIVTLAQRFLARYSAADGRTAPPRVTPDVWEALERYAWPGNVRELRNLAERVVALNDDGRVTLADLPLALRPGTEFDGSDPNPTPLPYHEARTRTMRAFQAAYVKRLLGAAGGNISAAARSAGVSRRTVQRWLEGTNDQ